MSAFSKTEEQLLGSLRLRFLARAVARDCKLSEQHQQRSDIRRRKPQSQSLLFVESTARLEPGVECAHATDHELHKLQQRHVHLPRGRYAKRRERVVRVHQRVDARVEHNEHPHKRVLLAHKKPHDQYCASVVKCLQKDWPPALQDDDDRIQDFIQFADVEQPR